jgi:phosphoglycerate dehydrogenase-like enzyme
VSSAPRVVIAEALHASPEALGDGFEIMEVPDLWSRRDELLARVAEADALVVRNMTRVDRELLAAAGMLRVVGRLGSGLDNIDLGAMRERGIELIHGRGLNSHAVAEYVIGAAVAVGRRLVESDRDVRQGRWSSFPGQELAGGTLGVVGGGETGAAVCRLGLALEMTVLCHDPYREPPYGAVRASLDDLLRRSLVVSLHVPLTEETRHLIGARELGLMRRDAILINVARGDVVDEEALAAALSAGMLGGAALDVRSHEPPVDDPLRALDRVLLTAHLAGHTKRSQRAIADHVLAGIRNVIEGNH